MQEKTCPVTSRISQLMKLDVAPENSEVIANRATNKASSTETVPCVMSPGTRHTAADVKENEPSKRHKSLPLRRGNDDSMFPDSLEEAEDGSYWPELSAPEFASVGFYGMLLRRTSR